MLFCDLDQCKQGILDMKPTTRAQREACYAIFCRSYPEPSFNGWARRRMYREFRKRFHMFPSFGSHYLGGEWNGMFYGIEPDGYTHT